jgi:hypothetical protein
MKGFEPGLPRRMGARLGDQSERERSPAVLANLTVASVAAGVTYYYF